ncbi:MAG: TIGR03768 family metallophosphoesterase [Terracidiphilus sp.]
MAGSEEKKCSRILTSDALKLVHGVSRREFIRYSAGAAAGFYVAASAIGCGTNSATATSSGTQPTGYPIDSTVVKTTDRVLSFALPPKPSGPNSGTGLYPTELPSVSKYAQYSYGNYTFGGPLPVVQRFDIMPSGYSNPSPTRLQQLANFFAITDVHITDKEAPNQFIYAQQEDAKYASANTSLYSPVMLCTTQVLDTAIQTINALHKQAAFDFGISLGDVCNSSGYNELRWYIDIMDGNKLITPSSGANVGADTIDYQKPFRAAGLHASIPWYQVLGNHDHFWLGSVPIDADPSLNIRPSYTAGQIWAIGDLLVPNSGSFPGLFDTTAAMKEQTLFMGAIDGSTLTGNIIGAGPAGGAATAVAPDPNRRPLLRTEWIQEFFDSTSSPSGHGLNLVDPSMGPGFACYSFLPKADIPLKIIVLDDTQSETDGSHDIHGHGFLDTQRWDWLQAELASGQANNQLMIIAAHIPIAVAEIASEMEWWEGDANATEQNAVSLASLVAVLQNTPNLLMWMAGHRHLNTVKAFMPPAGGSAANGFWQVETSSLRDCPQQFRTFEIYLNSDYSISIVTVNVDPAVGEGTPAATSRAYGIAALQITQNTPCQNFSNATTVYGIPVQAMDPTRAQNNQLDPTIVYGSVPGVPLVGSYNAELFKQLSPTMISALQKQFGAA